MVEMYSIRDVVMDRFAVPFLANNPRHACLQFDMACSQAEKAGYKSELQLYYLGEFDDVSGMINAAPVPKKVNTLDFDFEGDETV